MSAEPTQEKVADAAKKNLLSRRFCLTLWQDPTGRLSTDDCKYFLACKEQCPTTQKVHWQAYIEFDKPTRVGKIKKLLQEKTLHAIASKGSPMQNYQYCTKTREGDLVPNTEIYEIGVMSKGQGERTDIATLREMIMVTGSCETVYDEAPETYFKYRNGWRDAQKWAQKRLFSATQEITVTNEKFETRALARDWIKQQSDVFVVEGPCPIFDEYQGEKTLAWINHGHEDPDRLIHPIGALPTKTMAAYACWTSVVLIRIPTKISYEVLKGNTIP